MTSWASRSHWLRIVLPAALRQGDRVLKRHHIASDTFTRIMAAHALHADDTTGRGCTIDVDHLAQVAGCSERTVQRARAAARELGIAHEVLRGRHLTLPERIQAYDRGSRQRGLASVYALGCPAALARRLWTPNRGYPQPSGGAGERGTPPVGRSPTGASHRSKTWSSSPQDGDDRAARGAKTPEAPPRHPPPGPRRRRGGYWDPAALELARALQALIPALRRVHPGRLAPALTRFTRAPRPWTAREVQHAGERVLRAHHWAVPDQLTHPAAWWARLLRDIDHAGPSQDHSPLDPAAAAAAERATAHQRRATEAAERAGTDLCPHGFGGADTTARSPRCAHCRRHQPHA